MIHEPFSDIRKTISQTAQEFAHYNSVSFPFATAIENLDDPMGKSDPERIHKITNPQHPISWEYASFNGLEGHGIGLSVRRAMLEARLGFATGAPRAIHDWAVSDDRDLLGKYPVLKAEADICMGRINAQSDIRFFAGRHVTHAGISQIPSFIRNVRIVVSYCTDNSSTADRAFHFLRSAIHERIQFFKSTGQLFPAK